MARSTGLATRLPTNPPIHLGKRSRSSHVNRVPPGRRPSVKRPLPRTSPLWRMPMLRSSRHSTTRSEEHTSELQSRQYLVCRLLLEKKKDDEIEAGLA